MFDRIADIPSELFAPSQVMPSPAAWEDEVLYFILVDRFSDGREDNPTPLCRPIDRGNAVRTREDKRRWREAGTRFVGGNLKGIQSKLGYLQRLGVTALWISPVLKQAPYQETYHGYATQDFLRVDPRFGTDQDLKDLVKAAHDHGIRVVLDVILNHAGDVFAYREGRALWNGDKRPVAGFRDRNGRPRVPFVRSDPERPDTWPDRDAAVWPVELQDPAAFTCEGRIADFDRYPEYVRGDIFSLKHITLGEGGIQDYEPSPAFLHLCAAYEYWIAAADLDGFRVDAVKHMDPGATRLFTYRIHEFARQLGKENFYLIGEVAGGREFAIDTMRTTGLDAVLGIVDTAVLLEEVPKGLRNPNDYFRLFRDTAEIGLPSHTYLAHTVVLLLDDHDQIRKNPVKARFCAAPDGERLILAALGMQACTLGIPCVYYGTEQAFDGHGSDLPSDRFLREAMFGGEFGAFRTRGVHFFDEEHRVYQELSKILDLRRRTPALRRGRQFLRPISGDGERFGLPERWGSEPMRAIVPWSRLHLDHEVLCAINTDPDSAGTSYVTIDGRLHRPGDALTCLYSTNGAEIGSTVNVEARNGLSVRLTVPPAGFVVYG